MLADNEEIFDGFEDADVLFMEEPTNQDAVIDISQRAYLNNDNSFGEEQDVNSSSKSTSMGSHCSDVSSSFAKSKIMWTSDLHNKFLDAVNKLGLDNAVPRKILEMMKVEGLTRDHVASHLQKYRILSKKISDANCGYQYASKPILLESSMTNGAQWKNSSLMFNEESQEQRNSPTYTGVHMIPVLDTSCFYIPVLEGSNFNATTSSEVPHLGSLPIQVEGYSMQTMPTNVDGKIDLIDDTITLDVTNPSNFSVVPNLDGVICDHGGGSLTTVHPNNNIEMVSLSRVHSNNMLVMNWTGNARNFPFVESSNGLEGNYSSQNEYVEMGSLCEYKLNSNMENGIAEDDLILNDADIASLLAYADHDGEYGNTSDNLPVTLTLPNQDVNRHTVTNIVSFDSNHNGNHVNEHQSLEAYFPSFDPSFNMLNDEQLMEPIWSPELIADDMALEGLYCNPYVQD